MAVLTHVRRTSPFSLRIVVLEEGSRQEFQHTIDFREALRDLKCSSTPDLRRRITELQADLLALVNKRHRLLEKARHVIFELQLQGIRIPVLKINILDANQRRLTVNCAWEEHRRPGRTQSCEIDIPFDNDFEHIRVLQGMETDGWQEFPFADDVTRHILALRKVPPAAGFIQEFLASLEPAPMPEKAEA